VSDAARLFFALWPDAATRARLGRWSAEFHKTSGGRRIRDEQLHLTLAFLGDVLVDRLPDLRAMADSLIFPSFTLRFTAPDYGSRKRLAWAPPAENPDALTALATGLALDLRAAGFRVEDRRFVPHVTLVRDAQRPVRCGPFEAFDWRVQNSVLVRSKLKPTGSAYEVIGQWPLVPSQ
jgi:2'-5' RNA ligase